VVGTRLKRHVMKNQDKLIEGINNVTRVEDDLRVRFRFVGACPPRRLIAVRCMPAAASPTPPDHK
jgi:hypothetical protein